MQIRVRNILNKEIHIPNSEPNFTAQYTSSLGHDFAQALSDEAKQLLLEATKDRDGVILCQRFMGGQAIQTNGVNFANSADRRSIARWEAAVEQLANEGLVSQIDLNGDIFQITNKGFEVADSLTE